MPRFVQLSGTLLFACLALAACAQVEPTGTAPQSAEAANPGPSADDAAPPPMETAPMPNEPEGSCNSDAAQRFVGLRSNDDIAAQAKAASGAKALRVIGHDMMVTMDFRPDRLNIHLDEQGKIVRISCG